MTERVIMLAGLQPGARDQALAVLERTADESDLVTDRQGVFLSERDVVFFFEGPNAHASVREFLNDPVRSTMIAPWLPLLDGPLHEAREAYFLAR